MCNLRKFMKKQLSRFRAFFSENAFFSKLANFGRSLGTKTVYTSLLLYYAYKRKDTPSWAKRIVLGALGYLVVPLDVIPDLSPFIGYTDDIGILSFALVTVAAYVNDEVKEKARKQLVKWIPRSNAKDIEEVEKQL